MVVAALVLFFISVFLGRCRLLAWYMRLSLPAATSSSGAGIFKTVVMVVKILRPFNHRLKNLGYTDRLKKRLVRAGLYGDFLDELDFWGCKELVCLAVPVPMLLLGIQNPLYLGLGLCAGFLLPDLWLWEKIKKRESRIKRGLPTFLDMLTLLVESGADFTSAIRMIVEKSRPDVLIQEFAFFLNQLKLGKSRSAALAEIDKRTKVSELSSFIQALIQSERLGTSLGQVLRIQSRTVKTRRMQRAEKLAPQAPVKMLGPLIICIFPVIFLVLFGPIILELMGL
jgi:tight adherence protein C